MKTSTWLALIGGAFLVVIGVPLGLVFYIHAKHDAARARVDAALSPALGGGNTQLVL